MLLRALPALALELPKVGLMVVGIGEDLEPNQQLAVDLGIADRVQLHRAGSECRTAHGSRGHRRASLPP